MIQPIRFDNVSQGNCKSHSPMTQPHQSRVPGWIRILLFVSLLLTARTPATAQESAASGNDPFSQATTKKGLQVQMVDDALNLGIQHAAINLNLSQLIDPAGRDGNPYWEKDGRKFHFRADYLAALERQIKPLSDRNVLVYVIVLVYVGQDDAVSRILVHPQYDPECPNRISAFNVVTEEGRDWLTATFHFLARRWSGSQSGHGRVVGYIIGNEVNSHWMWSNRGKVRANDFIDEYVQAVSIASKAVRAESPTSRVYISLDHFWNRPMSEQPGRSMPGKLLLDRFAFRQKNFGEFEWHIAYHPYPENLFTAAFWKDTSPTHDEGTPRITMKNLDVLTTYLQRPELLQNGLPRRVILSEQGFHSYTDDRASEELQAAAFCLAWKVVERNPGIDAFIYHRHVDHAAEGGLNLGLWARAPKSVATPLYRKPIHHVFQMADTPDWEEAFRFALPIIGQPDWETAVMSLSREKPRE